MINSLNACNNRTVQNLLRKRSAATIICLHYLQNNWGEREDGDGIGTITKGGPSFKRIN